jgi:signal transduction histidine kinase
VNQTGDQAMLVRAPMRGRLFRKYALVLVALLSATLLAGGLVQGYFSYQESRSALGRIQREQAVTAATRIEQFVGETERRIRSAQPPAGLGGSLGPDERRVNLLRLLAQAPEIAEISYVDATGREQLRVSSVARNVIGSNADRSNEPAYLNGRLGQTWYGAVYFREGSEPFITIAAGERGPAAGVTVAEVNLKFLWDVVSRIKVGEAGHAYVVDNGGQLIAHPDIARVLQRTDLSALEQVRSARAVPADPEREAVSAADLNGREVLSSFAPVFPPGWYVFVEQPQDEAFAPLNALVLRTALLLAAGLAVAVAASLFLARRMTLPIRALQAGAASIGAGNLDQQIAVRTGDELEALAGEFNQMTARLRESYAGLERKVEERTHELTEALAQQQATGEVLELISRAPVQVQAVLDGIVAHAVRLFATPTTVIYFVEGDQLCTTAIHEPVPGSISARRPLDRTSISGTAVLERRTVYVCGGLEEVEQAYPAAAATMRRQGVVERTVVAVPLIHGDAAVGVLVVARLDGQGFTAVQIALAETFAAQAMIAIENARLFHEIEDKSQALELANQELVAVSRHKSEFLATMSHELRTPLNAIIGFSEVLLERYFGDLNEKQDDYLRDVLSSGQHLLALINDLLDLAKVEAGRMELDATVFSLRDAIETSLTMVRERAARHGIELSVEVAPPIEFITADERKVKQILFNLLSNAVKFTPGGGCIDVRAWTDDTMACVSVRDTGIGIAPEDQARIFEEFRQAGAATAQEGTGLGLALTKAFVELHGGRLSLESEPGHGSTFTFSLPLCPVPVLEADEIEGTTKAL